MIQDMDAPKAPGATLQCLEPQWTTFAGPLLREKSLRQHKVYHYSISVSFQLRSSVNTPPRKVWIFYQENGLTMSNMNPTSPIIQHMTNTCYIKVVADLLPVAWGHALDPVMVKLCWARTTLTTFPLTSFDILQEQPNAAACAAARALASDNWQHLSKHI